MRMTQLATLLASAMIWAQSAQAQGLTSVQVTVAGTNDEWTTTSVTVAPGDILLIRAEGRVRIGQVLGEVGPDGNSSGQGALQMKIGVGAGQRVGAKAFVVVEQGGEVKLRVFDSRYDDNAGSFTASLIHIPSSAIPQPRAVGEAPQLQRAVPTGTEAAYVAQVRADLRNLVTAEESFFADKVRYTSSLADLSYRASTGVTVTIRIATGTGWSATATQTSLPGYVCAIYVGSVGPPLGPQNEGEPVCFRR